MSNLTCAWVAALTIGVAASIRADEGLVAHWDFDEGSGDVLHDRSGSGNHGRIYGARWVKLGEGYALGFDGRGDHVDCGTNASLNLTGDLTIVAWVKLAASPFPNRNTNWYIVDCETYRASGYMLRVDGETSRLTYRSSQAEASQEAFSKASLENNRFYHVAAVKQGNTLRYYIDNVPDIQFQVKDPQPATTAFRISTGGQSFHGLMDDLRIYNRALSWPEVLGQYKPGAGARGKDTSWFGNLRLTPYFYFDEGQVVVELNLMGVLPLQPDEAVVVEMGRPGQKPVVTQRVTTVPETGLTELTLPLGTLPRGDYAVRAVVKKGEEIKAQATVGFRYPPARPSVPAPSEKMVGPLPDPPPPLSYRFELGQGGGFNLYVNGDAYGFESSFSYPHGGRNLLAASARADDQGEPSWTVKMERVTDEEFKVRASGQYYTLDRHILVRPDHVKVEDTIRNNTPQDLGVLIWNRFDLGPQKFEEHFLAGYKTTGRSQGQASPSVFVGRKEVWSVMNRGEAVSRQQARPGQGQATSSRERL